MNNVKELIIFGASKLDEMAFFHLKNQYKINGFVIMMKKSGAII